MEKKHELIDNAAEKRYEFDLGGDLAMIEYIKAQANFHSGTDPNGGIHE